MALLELKDLLKHYPSPEGGRSTVLDVPEFTLQAGEQVALEGASGSGKTTLLHIVAGILTPDSGSVSLAGNQLNTLSESAVDRVRAEHIGYVFQTFNLLQGYTALENVLLGMAFSAGQDVGRAHQLLERVGIADKANHLPSQLSVGQQQRVAIARAIANRPSLLLADEPTGNLDADMAQQALTLLREACEEVDAAILLVSHDPAVLGAFEDRRSLTELNRAAKVGGAA
ncbi:MAG: ABC transporter ATP-binding protein [Planctomycetes bacterium]|nr:ABC transporter ATP-binding protein [Planctomycetota bacterium]